MTNYWLIRTHDGPVEGPFTAAQIKSMARQNQLPRAALLADDSGKWVQTEQVRGLFEPPRTDAQAMPVEQSGYELETGPSRSGTPHIVPPPLVGAEYPAQGHRGPTGRERRLGWFIVLTSILVAFGLATMVVTVVESVSSGQSDFESLFDPDAPLVASDFMACGGFLGSLALWIIWVIWIYRAHNDVRRFTSEQYSISPGLALGLCFVPLFNLFWQVYMPYRLAQFIEKELRTGTPSSRPMNPYSRYGTDKAVASVSAGTVLALQIVAMVGGCCVQGLPLLLFGISAFIMQRGLNQLWRTAAASGLVM